MPKDNDDVASAYEYRVGDRVLAARRSGAQYPATITSANRDGSFTVRWDSGETREARQDGCSLLPLCCAGEAPAGFRLAEDPRNANELRPLLLRPAGVTPRRQNSTGSGDADEQQPYSGGDERADALLRSLGCSLTAAQLAALPRFVRLVGRGSVSLSSLREELEAAGLPSGAAAGVSSAPLPDFACLPAWVPISPLMSHRSGGIVGQDLSSGVAVRALLSGAPAAPRPCHMLELCCAPGGKLLYAAELLLPGAPCGQRTVTGTQLAALSSLFT